MTIKERAFNAALQNKKILLEQKRKELDNILSKVFSNKEISLAQQEFTRASFVNFDGSQDKLVKDKEKAYLNTLKKYGYTIKDVTPLEYLCDKCKDTGKVNGKVCSCIKENFINQLVQESGLGESFYTISEESFDRFKDEKIKVMLMKYYHQMQVLATKYPNIKKNTFLFIGKTGTGKTHLSQATAGEFIINEHSVKYVSAYKFNAEMIKVHTSPVALKDAAIEDYLSADLLVIDDLGTEPITRNVTLEYLYLVLTQRQEANKPTLITTNLDGNGIMMRYQERIFSRLTSKVFSLIYNFTGSDLRIK